MRIATYNLRMYISVFNPFTLVADSNQGGVVGAFNPFTNSQGAWKCRNGEITAKTLNFTLSGSEGSTGGIARQNFSVRFNRRTQTLQGTINLRLFDLTITPSSPI
ncbi:MAG: hypothetical protein KME54_16840 [Tolypothrix brevis GSE-NOS-MK-07-07A]|nr:hypothetical protein [Tolypothrix brevis GSE-NOS-MK-07-07A]